MILRGGELFGKTIIFPSPNNPLFVIPYIKDCIKNVILNVYALFISFHNVCGKVCLICGKVSLIVVINPLTNAL